MLVLLGVGYICIFMKISELSLGMHLRYLETVDPLLLISSLLNHFFSLVLCSFLVF